jgi:hypothetical protein
MSGSGFAMEFFSFPCLDRGADLCRAAQGNWPDATIGPQWLAACKGAAPRHVTTPKIKPNLVVRVPEGPGKSRIRNAMTSWDGSCPHCLGAVVTQEGSKTISPD